MRPPRLVLRFAVYTAFALALAAAAILWFLQKEATERARASVGAQARLLAYTTLRDGLRPSDFGAPVGPKRRAALDEFFAAKVLVEGSSALQVKLWSAGGIVTYSNRPGLIGSTGSNGDERAKALEGRTALEVTRLQTPERGAPGPKVLAAYVPVRLTGGVRPSGVFELDKDYSPVAAEIRSGVKGVAAGLALALLGLYTCLVPLLRRATKGLEQRARVEANSRSLAAQNERLRELDRLKDDFVSTVSHELRTPLTSIRGYVELLKDEQAGPLTGQQAKFVEVVDRNARRLLGLVGELLLMGQIQRGQLQPTLADVDLPEVVSESLEAIQPLADEREIELASTLGTVSSVAAERAQLAQMIDNLLSNAIKFTAPEGRVEISVFQLGGYAVVEVSDTGIGIPAAEQDSLFEPFFRASSAGERAIQGTGLGLPISKAIVEAHSGTIRIESEEGVGTTCRVELPLSAAPGAAAGRHDAEKAAVA